MDVHNSSNSLLGAWTYCMHGAAIPADWPCDLTETAQGSSCSLAELASSNATYWNPFPEGLPSGLSTNLTVNFCLAQKTNRTCHIDITPVIVWIVLAANLLKVICLFSTLFLVKGASEPLITTGDMIQSFILKPDPNLSRRCLASISQVKRDPHFWTAPKMPLQWLPKRRFWFRGASLSLWLSLFLPAMIGMASVIGLYAHNHLSSFCLWASLPAVCLN